MGGWTRLWILVSVIYVFPVGIFTYSGIPKKSQYEFVRFRETLDLVKEHNYEIDGVDELPSVGYEKFVRACHKQFGDTLDFTKIESDYKNKINNHRKEQFKIVGTGFVFWIVPVVLLYLLGWSIRWVIEGFKKG